jgi:hypothetical protein
VLVCVVHQLWLHLLWWLPHHMLVAVDAFEQNDFDWPLKSCSLGCCVVRH